MTKAQDTDAQARELAKFARAAANIQDARAAIFQVLQSKNNTNQSLTEENDRLKVFNRDYAEECARLERRVGELEDLCAEVKSQEKFAVNVAACRAGDLFQATRALERIKKLTRKASIDPDRIFHVAEGALSPLPPEGQSDG